MGGNSRQQRPIVKHQQPLKYEVKHNCAVIVVNQSIFFFYNSHVANLSFIKYVT